MKQLLTWFKRFANLFNKGRVEREFSAEIEANLQFQIDDNIRAGMTPEEARRAALIKFGSIDAAKEAVRDRQGIPVLEMFARDVRYAFRILRRDRGWTAVAVASLALAIGANTGLFGVLNAALLTKLPVPRPDELVALRWAGQNDLAGSRYRYGYLAADPKVSGATFPHAVFERLREESRETADLFAFVTAGSQNVIVRGNGDIASCQFVSGNFYRALGIPAELGRLISPDDDSESAEPVIVISDAYWRRRFGADPSIVGTGVTINGASFAVAGIVPSGFGDLGLHRASSALYVEGRPADVWIPFAMEPRIVLPNLSNMRAANWWLHVMGRLKPRATPRQLEARLESVFVNAAKDDMVRLLRRGGTAPRKSDQAPQLRVVSGNRGVYDTPPSEPAMLGTLGAVFGTVLIIVCVNLTNLMLSRAAKRQREIAVRVSIGATRARLLAQLLTESMVLSAAGGAAGFLAAYGIRSAIPAWLGYKAGLQPIDMDWSVIGFAAGITMLTGLVFGVVPALRASRVDSATAVRDGSGQLNRSRSRLSRGLVVAQVALSLMLVTIAGLFLRTFTNLQHMDIGFNPERILMFGIDTGLYQGNRQKRSEFYDEAINRIQKIPAVRSISFSDLPVLSGASISDGFSIEGRSEDLSAQILTVNETFFSTMEIPIKSGRGFKAQDDRAAPLVVVINEALAREFFPNADPVGRVLSKDGALREIIGVVADIKLSSLRAPAPATIYMPHRQVTVLYRTFEVRTVDDPAAVLPAIRDAVHQIDSKIPLVAVSTQMETIGGQVRQERMFAFASSIFGSLALSISMIGLFGLMSYAVAQRTKEIGIRMSLGAERADILRSVMREALVLVSLGIAIGFVATLAMSGYIESRLFGLSAHDPLTLVLTISMTLIVATVAAYFPARRASRVDPLVALRYE